MVVVQPAGEDGPAFHQEHRVVHTQSNSQTPPRQLDWSRYQLDGLGPEAESPAPAVAAGQHLPSQAHEGRVELLYGDLAYVHILLPKCLHQVWLGAVGVVSQAEVVVGVCPPDVRLQGGGQVIREVAGSVQHSLVQSCQAVVVQQCHVGPEPDQHDDSAELAVEDGPVEGGVAGLLVLPVELAVPPLQQPPQHLLPPGPGGHVDQTAAAVVLAGPRVGAVPVAPGQAGQLAAGGDGGGQLAAVLAGPAATPALSCEAHSVVCSAHLQHQHSVRASNHSHSPALQGYNFSYSSSTLSY